MPLGYEGKLYILAFDHRGSFQKKWFGLGDEITQEDTDRITDAKTLIYEGLELALSQGAEPSITGALVDEQFGGEVPQRAKEHGIKLSMPVEKSGQNEFDFHYGEDFGAHIEKFDPDFSKVLVRYNPDDPDTEMNKRQLERLKRLADWLHEHDGKFLFELLVPPPDAQLEQVGGDSDRYDAELRPELMRRAIVDAQEAGVEVDIWKIEGVDERADCEMLAEQSRRAGRAACERLAEQSRSGGRDGVVCVLLGRGASDEKVDHWLKQAAPVEGFIGFAICRSIWGDALTGYIDGSLERAAAAKQVADNYLRFVKVYEDAEAAQPAGA